jgi:hypothetical protein
VTGSPRSSAEVFDRGHKIGHETLGLFQCGEFARRPDSADPLGDRTMKPSLSLIAA